MTGIWARAALWLGLALTKVIGIYLVMHAYKAPRQEGMHTTLIANPFFFTAAPLSLGERS